MQCRRDPSLFKVGYTARKTVNRRAEINRVAGDDMRIVQTVTMPWAYSCEGLVLCRIRREWFRRRDRRGTEWFRLKRGENIDQVARKIRRCADRTVLVAKLKRSWPPDTTPIVFRSKVKDTITYETQNT